MTPDLLHPDTWEYADDKRKKSGITSIELKAVLRNVYTIPEFTPLELTTDELIEGTVQAFERYWLNNSGVLGHVTEDGFVVTSGGMQLIIRNITLESANEELQRRRKKKRIDHGYSEELVGIGDGEMTPERYAAVRTAVLRIRNERIEKQKLAMKNR